MTRVSLNKSEARNRAKAMRRTLASKAKGRVLIESLPPHLDQNIIAGFAPFGDEIDVWPLLKTLHHGGRQIALPVVTSPHQALEFRTWTPNCAMKTDQYGISYPVKGSVLIPQLLLIPLLAFTLRGERLGYGGGYYDRTLEALRKSNEVFACGVAYAGQEVDHLPADAHDQSLDGILTELDFRTFA